MATIEPRAIDPWTECRHRIEHELEQFLLEHSDDRLFDPMTHILSNGGKRLRPALVLLACRMFDGDMDNAIRPALGIEVFHNFTLMHDDLMDRAPLRRGKATVHESWGDSSAILSGDAMFVKAYSLMMEQKKSPRVIPILTLFNEVALEVCQGQQADMSFEDRGEVTLGEYLDMIEKKTAALIDGSLRTGAALADAGEKEKRALSRFGRNLGIAFQLQDDLLDIYGEQNKTGKQVGGDIRANKKTYLLIKALEKASPEQQEHLDQLYQGKQNENERKKVEEVMAIFDALEVEGATREAVRSYQQKAEEALNTIDVPRERKAPLLELSGQLTQRES